MPLALDYPHPRPVDCGPAIAMREELARARAAGKDFDQVWQFAILRVTRDLPNDKPEQVRQGWINIFAEQRHVWRAAYYGEPVPDLLRLLAATED